MKTKTETKQTNNKKQKQQYQECPSNRGLQIDNHDTACTVDNEVTLFTATLIVLRSIYVKICHFFPPIN